MLGIVRGAIFGDVLSNFLKFYGHNVVKEYYINDYGNQIYLFVKSVYFRIIELQKGKTFPEDQGLYPGEYIIDIAKDVLKKIKNENISSFDETISILTPYAIKSALDIIKKDLDLMGIVHDNFVSESDIVNRDILSEAIEKLKKKETYILGYCLNQKVMLKIGNLENNYYLNLQSMEMTLIEHYKNQIILGHILPMT